MQIAWIRKGLKTGVLTTRYPAAPEPMPAGFRGRPVFDPNHRWTEAEGRQCAAVCPTRALAMEREAKGRPIRLRLDLGSCIGCGLCVEAGPKGALSMDEEYELAVYRTEDLWTDLVFNPDLLGENDGRDE